MEPKDPSTDITLPDLTATQACRALNVHKNTLRRMLQDHRLIGAYRIGTRGDWRIPRSTIRAWKGTGGTWIE